MNKIFKIVFNAARGKMMVVNEATSSVQTGKKAAVTVAVASALMLGANVSVAKVVGGDNLSYAAKAPAEFKDVLTLDVTEDTDEVISGHYFGINTSTKYLQDGEAKTFVVKSTSTKIAQDVEITEGVYAGSKIAGGYPDGGQYPSVTLNLKNSSTNLTIDAGNFGTSTNPNNAEIAMRKVVTAGDFIKDRGTNYGGPVVIATEIDSANMTINDGTFYSTVFGGSVLTNYAYDKVNMSSTVTKSNVTITGGTFKSPIFAGGAAMNLYGDDPNNRPWEGSQITSIVKESNLVIQGGDFIQGIYTGGLEGYINDVVEVVPHADVTVANVTVLNSEVSKILGYNVKGVINDGIWRYTNLEAVNTNLKVINSSVETIDIAKGSVELRVEGEGNTSVGTLNVANGVDVVMSADGAFNDANGGDVGALAEKITIGAAPANVKGATTLKLDEGSVMGAVTATLEGGEVTGTTVAVNKKTKALAEKVTLAPQMITRIMMNDLRKRMGDIRAGEGTHGTWARYNGGEMSGQGIDNDFHMVQVGIDTIPEVGAPRVGVAFSYAQSEAEDGYGTTDMDSYSLAVYGTKMYDNGMFVDVIGRMATMDTDMINAGYKAKMDNVALSLSGEFGWRFDVTDSFFIEPSVEATYTYTDADKFTMGNGTYELEATNSLVGRAGFAAGFKCPANKGDVYVRAAVVHEFMGDTTMNSWTATGRQAAPVEADGEDTYFEYAIGAQFNINKNTYVYADIERTEGAVMDEDWRANVGVRLAF